MRTIAKKLKKSIVMLLVCALVTGSVPMNVFAAEIDSQPVLTDESVTNEVSTEEAATDVIPAEETTTEETVVEPNVVEQTETSPIEDGEAQEIEETQLKESGVFLSEESTQTTNVNLTFEGSVENVTFNVGGTDVTEADGVYKATAGVADDNTISFSVTPDEGYEVTGVTAKNGDNDVAVTPTETAYTIAYADGMTDVTVTITAEAAYTPYAISVESTLDNVEIVYDEGCTAAGENENSKVTVKDTNLVFSVNVADTHEVTKVSYKVGEAENATELTAGADGKYTIESTYITGAVIIVVEVKEKYVPKEVTLDVSEFADVVFTADCTTEEDETLITVEGKDLVFTAELKEEAKDSHEITGVSYKIDGSETATPIEKGEDGYYTIKNADITDPVTIIVDVEEVKYTVTFSIQDATVEKVTGEGEEPETYTDGSTVVVNKKGETVSFTVDVEDDYIVRNVKKIVGAEETELYTDENGAYHVDVTSDLTIKVIAEAKKETTISWSGDNMSIVGKDINIEDAGEGNYSVTVKEEDEVKFEVTVDEGYRLRFVTVTGATSLATKEVPVEDGVYTVKGTQENQTIVVETVKLAAENDKTVVFANDADHVTFKLLTVEGVTLQEGKKNTYTVKAGTEYIKFTVKTPANYEAIVDYEPNDGVEPFISVGNNGVETYEIAVDELSDNQIIRFSEKLDDKSVKLYYDESEVNFISATANGKVLEGFVAMGDESEDSPVKHDSVPYGTKITFTVEARENYKLTGIWANTGLKKQTFNKDSYTFTVEVKNDMEITIDSKAIETILLVENDGDDEELLTAVNNVYTIENYLNREYLAGVFRGSELIDAEEITKVEVLNSKNKTAKTTAIVDEEAAIIYITFDGEEVAKGTTLKLKVTTAAGTVNTSLKVLPKVTKVSVKGVKSKVLTQTADSKKDYAITLTPSNAINAIGVEYNDTEGVISGVTVENGKLVITTTSETGSAGIKLYDMATSTDEAKNYITGGDFTLKVTDPKLVSVKPTVKLQNATNVTMTLNLGATGFETPNEGSVWYEVKAVAVDAESAEKLGAKTEITEYFRWTGKSQLETININDSKDGNEVKEGDIDDPLKYNITVSLVQTTGETKPENSEDSNICFRTAANKVGSLRNASTKAPYYETKLTLKKGTTTVFTGQEDVVVATPQFNKLTSYTNNVSVKVQDSWGRDVSEDLIAARYEDGKILVTVDDQVDSGKYNLIVTAETKANTKEVSATMTFNVVYGINDIVLDTPNYIYKKDKKAASFKVNYTASHMVEYVFENEGESAVSKYPAKPNKNKVTLSIAVLDEERNEIPYAPILKYVTVKGGKVNVASNYIINGNDTFVVKAKAADYNGNEYTTYSAPITITNQTQELGEVVIAKYIYGSNHYTVIAQGKDTVCIDDLIGNYAKVLRKGVPEAEVYYEDDFIANDDLTFTSSNNNLVLNSYGYISGLKKAVNKVKITATSKDGSGKKATLSDLNIAGTKEDLKISIQTGGDFIETTVGEDGKFYGTFNGPQKTQLLVNVDTTTGYTFGGKAASYKVQFKNAKTISSYTGDGYGTYIIEPTKNDVEIILTNNNLKTTKTYVLTNESVSNSLPNLKSVKVQGSFRQYWSGDKIKLVLPDGYNGKYVKLTADNSKLQKDTKYRNAITRIDNWDGIFLVEENTIELTTRAPQYSGSYKMYACVGDVNDEGTFIAETKDKDFTFKVSSTKSETQKLTAKYTLNLKDGDSVVLKSTSKNNPYIYNATDLQNANIKGTPNNFRDYFTLDNSHGYYELKLKDEVTPEDIDYLLNEGKDNLTGWVNYGYEGQYSTQVTITLKNASAYKYAVSSATVVKAESMNPILTVTKNKQEVDIAHAYALGSWKVQCVDGKISMSNYEAADEYNIGKNEITLYVVSSDACQNWLDDLEKSKEEVDEFYRLKLRKYGVQLKVTVNILEETTVKGKDKISLASKKVTLTANNYNAKDNTYKAEFKYSQLINDDFECTMIPEDNSTTTPEDKYGVTYSIEQGKLVVSIPKSAFEGDDVLTYGGKLKYKFEFDFGETLGSETENVEIILPKQPKSYDDVIKDLQKAGIETIELDQFNNGENNAQGWYDWMIQSILTKVVPGDVEYTWATNVKPSDKGTKGSVVTTITFGDSEEQQKEYKIERELKALDFEPSDLSSKLSEVLSSYGEVGAEVSLTDLLADLKAEVPMSDYPNLRLSLMLNERVDSTVDTIGTLNCTFTIRDVYGNYEPAIVENCSLTISVIPSVDVTFAGDTENVTITVGDGVVTETTAKVGIVNNAITFSIAAKDNYNLKSVTAKNGDADVQFASTENNVYTIAHEEGMEALTVTIETEEIPATEPTPSE